MLPQAKGAVFLYHAAVDLRKSYIGLCSLVEQELKRDLSLGDAFIFVNKKKNLAKVLWWDRTGWCLLLKKLSVGRFRVSSNEELRVIEVGKMRYFFDGI